MWRARGREKDGATRERPRVLGVRFGVNPNSSSLGVDVTWLLFGGTLALAVSLVLGALLRRGRAEVVGEAEGAEPPGAEAEGAEPPGAEAAGAEPAGAEPAGAEAPGDGPAGAGSGSGEAAP